MTRGERISYRRKEIGLSVDELAEKIGKSRATIYRYENGDIDEMPISILEPLAKALNTSIMYLLGWSEDSSAVDALEKQLLSHFNVLNLFGKNEAIKRVSELALIPRYSSNVSILAAHERTDTDVTDEMMKHDIDIMKDDDF